MTPNTILTHARAYAHAHMATCLSGVTGVMELQLVALRGLDGDSNKRHARVIGSAGVTAPPGGAGKSIGLAAKRPLSISFSYTREIGAGGRGCCL